MAYPLRLIPLLALLLTACAGNPLGMSDDEWRTLSPDQKLAARHWQATLNAEAETRRAEERRAAEARAAQAEAAHRQRLNTLRATARYGDIVQCVIPRGVADFRPGWRDIDPVGATLVRSETQAVALTTRDGKRTMPLWLSFDEDGMAVSVCRNNPEDRGRRHADCQSFAGTAADFQQGLTGRINLPEILLGTLRCAFAPALGMPTTVIIR